MCMYEEKMMMMIIMMAIRKRAKDRMERKQKEIRAREIKDCYVMVTMISKHGKKKR